MRPIRSVYCLFAALLAALYGYALKAIPPTVFVVVSFEDADGDGDRDLSVDANGAGGGEVWLIESLERLPLGVSECSPAVTNSIGGAGAIRAHGSYSIQDMDVELFATSLPPASAGIFIASPAAGNATHLGGGVGTLCLGQPIYRLPGVLLSGTSGAFELAVDFQSLPVAVAAFSTWRFQSWHRDGTNGSNLTDAVAIQFVP